ncbi:MAG: Glycerol-3-phosphate cytidylyltransferase (EC [uncultured Campylobacterales bacterium]|uniref:Glycerol-3-phosphate cytidylyltransferase (EC) n=1 Tax=uncultured Campylobacterales bacterium TaxID=352960 RepID=A0A6S6SVG5_9BACT|nr:MAG: Glycerol-3-phosphate cytidylyltransferase (EC [uncultured Campylobacterales bacterium]
MAKIVITYGTFDLFHIGHLNILKRAKEFGDHLIVGVTSEIYDRSRGKLNVVQDLETRLNAIKKLDFVDKVIVETHKNQKIEDIKHYKVDRFVIGDDWIGKFDYLKDFCEVIYLPRTKDISSTQLRKSIDSIKLGIIGTGRIAHRFATECSFVEGIEVHSVYSRDMKNVKSFIQNHDILYGFDNLDSFLKSDIDAVYIASPHENHYEQSKKVLHNKKHLLCEKPITLKVKEVEELVELALENNLILLEAVKTAFLPAFNKLLDEIKSGIIGDVIEVKATFTKLIEDRTLREWQSPFGGATNELSTYPLLLATKLLGDVEDIVFYTQKDNNVDLSNTIICKHKDNKVSISTVGIGMKSEGEAVISGTKGYIVIPAPWWLTREFKIKFEDIHKEYNFNYEFEGDGLRYEISEFKSLINRKNLISNMYSHNDMLKINKIIAKFNEKDFK